MNNYGAAQMAASWRTVRKNTIQIAEEIPEEKYAFKATPDTMSVGETLAHLALVTHWSEQAHFANKQTSVSGEDFQKWFTEIGQQAAGLTAKPAIVEALKTRGEAFAAQLERLSDADLEQMVDLPGGGKSRLDMLLGVKEHEMHHRAQLMLVERLIGIVPHLTRARLARMQQMADQAKAGSNRS